MLTCTCPAAAALTTIPSVTCSESFGQIQKIAFQRLDASGVKNSFTSLAPIGTLGSWTALTSAADSTKIVVSPYVYGVTSEAGEARTIEGLSGIEEVYGTNPTTFSAQFRGVPQSTIAIIKELMCEAKANNLGVYLFDENGNIEALQDAGTPTTYYPIPVRALFVSDKTHGGIEAPDSNNISWSFLPNFSDTLAIVTPSFNPLTDL